MAPARSSRWPFLVTVALVAAAIADAIVETIANTHVFGGSYRDDNHLGIVPALLAGSVLFAVTVAIRFFETWRRGRGRASGGASERDWLADAARETCSRPPTNDLPRILVLQLVALFVLESCEQLVGGGRLLGGIAWLGGPPVFALATHAIVGIICTLTLAAFMRSVVRGLASLVHAAFAFIWLLRTRGSSKRVDRGARHSRRPRAQAPHVRQIGGRAPPLSPASAHS
jgi:hypothetical protein